MMLGRRVHARRYFSTHRINLWASPRTCSTSLMYSFAQRPDTEVVDEPLYCSYLKLTGRKRPYTDKVFASQKCDGSEVVAELVDDSKCDKPIFFMKHMSKHAIVPEHETLLDKGKNVFLVRDPRGIIPSWEEGLGEVDSHDLGLREHLKLLMELLERGEEVAVVDNNQLLDHPEGMLRSMCDFLDIDFQPEMLSWPKGGHAADGVWADHWYHSAHASTKFSRSSQAPKRPLPAHLRHIYDECKPMYEELLRYQLFPQPVLPDERNKDIFVYVNGEVVHRDQAKVSVFDSAVQGGDAVWEGLRVYDGKVFHLDEHLHRMQDSAKAMAFTRVPSNDAIKEALFQTLKKNNMRDGVHIRLTLTRGEKVSSGMSPTMNQNGCSLIVLAEWKGMAISGQTIDNAHGIRLITSAIRRNTPACVDSKIHHNNLINNILAKVEANLAGVDDALMLDMDGFVSETNATNFFIVREGTLLTPHADACLPGITRKRVIAEAPKIGIPVVERNLSLSEVWSAEEVFTTGTMGELSPVVEIDGRCIGDGDLGPVTQQLSKHYQSLTTHEGWPIPAF